MSFLDCRFFLGHPVQCAVGSGTGEVCFEDVVAWNFSEDLDNVLLSVMMFLDVYWKSWIPFVHSQMSLKVSRIAFEFPRYHGLQCFEPVLE